MLNEFNTAIMAEGIKMIAEGCKAITTVLEDMDGKSDVIEMHYILYQLQSIAQSNECISNTLKDIGAKIDTKAGDF